MPPILGSVTSKLLNAEETRPNCKTINKTTHRLLWAACWGLLSVKRSPR